GGEALVVEQLIAGRDGLAPDLGGGELGSTGVDLRDRDHDLVAIQLVRRLARVELVDDLRKACVVEVAVQDGVGRRGQPAAEQEAGAGEDGERDDDDDALGGRHGAKHRAEAVSELAHGLPRISRVRITQVSLPGSNRLSMDDLDLRVGIRGPGLTGWRRNGDYRGAGRLWD